MPEETYEHPAGWTEDSACIRCGWPLLHFSCVMPDTEMCEDCWWEREFEMENRTTQGE